MAESLLQEHERRFRIWHRNLVKRYDPATPPRSRFAYAAHVTKAERKLGEVESRMIRAGVAVPDYASYGAAS